MTGPRHRAEPGVDRARVGIWLISTLLGLLLLTGGGGTWSSWFEQTVKSPGTITAGSVALTGKSTKILLLSKQVSGSRTYVSSTTCSVSGYVECRDVTATLAQERLIPGDSLRITRVVTLAGAGTNLQGNVVLDASKVINKTASAFAGTATVSYQMTGPSSPTVFTTATTTFQAVRSTNTGWGDYTVQVDISTPTTNGGARWDTQLRGQSLPLGSIDASFNQTKA